MYIMFWPSELFYFTFPMMSKVLDMEVMVQFIYTPYHFKF